MFVKHLSGIAIYIKDIYWFDTFFMKLRPVVTNFEKPIAKKYVEH